MKLLLVLVASLALSAQLRAQAISDETIRLVEKLSDIVCHDISTSGGSSVFSFSAEAEIELRNLLKKFADAGGGADYLAVIEKYDNVPR